MRDTRFPLRRPRPLPRPPRPGTRVSLRPSRRRRQSWRNRRGTESWWTSRCRPGSPVKTWVVYPERKDKAGVVIVIHEIYGLSDWIRGVADQLARDGFLAIAPDLLSGHGPGGGGTDSAGSRDDVVKLIRELTP